MKLISHRGNVNGRQLNLENHPDYILKALQQGYDVEIDVWFTGKLTLGHDEPLYEFPLRLMEEFCKRLWIHCKSIEALVKFKELDSAGTRLNYFWHEHDTVTLTSKNFIWAYPGKQPIRSSIAVMPELNNDDVSLCVGICSDYIERYK